MAWVDPRYGITVLASGSFLFVQPKLEFYPKTWATRLGLAGLERLSQKNRLVKNRLRRGPLWVTL